MKKAFFGIAIYGLILTSCTNNTGLQLDPAKGETLKYNYDIMQANEVVNPENGNLIHSTGHYKYTSTVEFLGSGNDGFTAKINFADVVIRATAKGLPQGIDTTMQMQMLTGKGAEVKFDKNGKAIKVDNQDKVSDTAQSMMLLMLEFSKELFIRFPENNNEKTWTIERLDSMDQFGSRVFIRSKTNYNYLADVDTLGYKCAVIQYNMLADDFQMKNEIAEIMGVEMNMKGKGLANGKAYVDKKTGVTIMNRENITYEMEFSSKADDSTQTTPMKMQYTIYNVLQK